MKHRISFPMPAASHRASSKRVCLAVSACLAVSVCLAVSACGSDDDDDDTPVGPSGPVELFIDGFLNNENESFARDADEVVLSCDGTINVLFGPRSGESLENWALRGPGACESFEQCGYIVLAITPEGGGSTKFAAGANTSLLVAVSPGTQRLDADLYTGDGEPFLQANEPVEDTLSHVRFVARTGCDASTTSSGGTGSGGSSASGGSAGAPANGGSGGTGEAGAAGAAGAAGQASGGAAGDTQG